MLKAQEDTIGLFFFNIILTIFSCLVLLIKFCPHLLLNGKKNLWFEWLCSELWICFMIIKIFWIMVFPIYKVLFLFLYVCSFPAFLNNIEVFQNFKPDFIEHHLLALLIDILQFCVFVVAVSYSSWTLNMIFSSLMLKIITFIGWYFI